MNEREIRALLKETEAAAKKYKAQLQAKGASTGLKKVLAQEDKMYEPIKKGSGKPKYKNVDEAYRQAQLKDAKSKAAKKQVTTATKAVKQEATKGRTEKPSTSKVPVKPRGGTGMRGGLGSFGSGGGLRGSVNK